MNKISFYDEHKYMFLTSNLLLIPTLTGYFLNYKKLVFMNSLALIISSKFWHTGNNDIYRTIDLMYQPINTITFLAYGNLYSNNIYTKIIGNILFFNGLYFFNKSHIEYKKKNRFWFINHVSFHLCMITGNILAYF
jgi:hypothetical protein